MADAILTRDNGTSVTIPILEAGGTLAVARDIGKPNLQEEELGREDVFTQDQLSAGDAFTVTGRLRGSNAYADAKTLAEDIIKPQLPSGGPTTLDLSGLPSRSTYSVAPASKSACRLTYPVGEKDRVDVQLTLNVIDSVSSDDSQAGQSYPSPDAGDGVKLDRSGTSVTLRVDDEVQRTVGRPGIDLTPAATELPVAFDNNQPAVDEFELSGELVSDTAESDAQTLEESIIRPRLYSDTLDLHFLGSRYTLDAYPVAPVGSQAVRTVSRAGETGIIGVPALTLRVVDNT